MRKFDFKNMTLRDWWQLFRRKMWLLILPPVIVVAVAVPYSLTLTPIYQASAILISGEVNEGSILEGLVAIRLTPREKIRSVTQKIQSRTYMTNVVEQTNIAEYLQQKKQRPVTNRDVTDYLKSIVTVRSKGGDLVSITVTHEDPDIAMNLANIVADVYVANTLKDRQKAVSGSIKFIDEQLDYFRGKLAESEQTLLDERKKGVLQSLDQENTILLAKLTKLDINAIELDLELQQTQEELRQAKERLRRGATIQFINPEILPLKTEVAGLNAQLMELQKKYSDEWPDVKKLKMEVAQKEAELSRAESKIPPKKQENTSIEVEYWQDKLVMLTIQKSALAKNIAENNRKLQQLPRKQLEMARLTREKSANESIFSMLLGRRNNAMLMDATEKEKKGHVAGVFETAIRPESPIAPNKKKIVVMAFALGLMMGGGAAFLLEYFNHSFYSIEEVEEYLSLPVLGAIHKITTYESELRARRNKPLKLAFAGFGGLMFLLLIIDFINFRFFTHNSQFLTIARRILP